MSTFWAGVAALVPSVGVGVLFYLAMRFIVRADRNERENLAELDRLSPRDENEKSGQAGSGQDR